MRWWASTWRLPDAYLSVVEALTHGGAAHDTRVKIRWVPSEDLEHQPADRVLDGVDGILVPGGFGSRGVEGMVVAARYARERKIPYFGICLGMQVAVIEIARNVCGLEGANSSEFDPDTPHPVVDLMPDQADVDNLGGTMRLGLYPCVLEEGSLSRELYGEAVVYERHRHRFELNNAYRSVLADAGLRFVGASPDGRLVEMVELPDHPWSDRLPVPSGVAVPPEPPAPPLPWLCRGRARLPGSPPAGRERQTPGGWAWAPLEVV